MYSTDFDVSELERPTKASSVTTNITKTRIKTPRNVTYATLVCKTTTVSGKDEKDDAGVESVRCEASDTVTDKALCQDSVTGARRDNVDLSDSNLRSAIHSRKDIPLTIADLSSHSSTTRRLSCGALNYFCSFDYLLLLFALYNNCSHLLTYLFN